MPIRVICPTCGRVGKAPDNALGRKAQCPGCQTKYVLTADLIQDESDSDETASQALRAKPEVFVAPAPVRQVKEADDSYGLDPEAVETPKLKRPAARPPVIAGPPASAKPEPKGGATLPIPALVGGAIGLVLVSVLGAWGVGLFGGSKPAGEAPQQALATQDPAPATTPIESASAVGEVSVASMLLLDEPSSTESIPKDQGAESDVVAKARAGAASVAASNTDAGKPLSTAEIVEESEPSVALIKGKSSSGTGFLVGPGLVATNAHVIDDEFASDLEVQFVSADDAHNEPIHAELLYEDPERDLAFLAVKTDLKPLRVAKTYAFRKGEDITVIGNPGMGDGQVLENAISRGVMSTKAKIDEKNFYQLNIAINPGNSGGPVFDSSGRVIGVATLKSAKQEATGFSIPIEDLQAAIAKVGTQSIADVEKCRSSHRTKMAVKALGGGGALLCVLIDVRKADAAIKSPQVKEVLNKLEPVADAIEKELMPTLAIEGPLVRNDASLANSVRGMYGELTDNFTKLRNATANKKIIDDRDLRIMKQNHRRLITGLATALKIEFPKEMMVAFDDHTPTQPTIVTMSPSNLGNYSSRLRPKAPNTQAPSRTPNRASSARERLQQKRNGGR